MVQQNPSLLNAILQQIGQTNPALLQMISQNQAAFFRMLTEPSSSTTSSGTAPAGGALTGSGGGRTEESPRQGQEEGAGDYFAPGVIHVTPQDKEAIERVYHMENVTFNNWRTNVDVLTV